MSENTYQFDIPQHLKSIIKVIGVGGGGTNAVNHMYNEGIQDVEFIVCNTDAQSLNNSPVPNKIQLGLHLTEGLGAGANPEVGKNAALETKEELRELLSDETRMVFITAGMGGGTGTGAAPVIAKVARELDILTVGIVTSPFAFEGRKKMQQAADGIRELRENCDTVLVILNDNLREIYGNLSITKAFGQADNILMTAAKGIAEIITVSGHVNVDFEDVKATMKNSGVAIMGSAETSGENRALIAAEQAISSPLLDNKDITGAQKILLSIISGEEAELQMDELSEITNFIQEKAGVDAQVIFGHGNDAELGDAIRVTVIATGFEGEKHPDGDKDKMTVFDLESSKQIDLFKDNTVNVEAQPTEPFIKEPTNEFVENSEVEETIENSFVEDEIVEKNYSFTVETQPEIEPEGETEREVEFEVDEHKDFKPEVVNANFKTVYYSAEDADFLSKKEQLKKEALRRSMEIRAGKQSDLNADNFKKWLDIPAYERKKVQLQNVPHSSEVNISRYNLNDDMHISKNNPYLHDRPD